MNINTGGPAFPAGAHFGMTLRDYFAGQALAGMNASEMHAKKMAEWAYETADAMLAAREAKQ